MSSDSDSWKKLAEKARRSGGGSLVFPPDWSRKTARHAMRQATLSNLTWTAWCISLWLKWKLWIVLLTVTGIVGVTVAPRIFRLPSTQRYERWAAGSLRYLRQTHPLECEESGLMGQLVWKSVEALHAQEGTKSQIRQFWNSTRTQLINLLPPPEQKGFLDEDERLRRKWLPEL